MLSYQCRATRDDAGSEALDTAEHLGLILGSQKQADTLLRHFGSLNRLVRASVQELLPFVSRSKALEIFLRSFLCKSRGTKVL